MNRIDRIRAMEALFDECRAALCAREAAAAAMEKAKSAAAALADYQASGLWLEDFEADEAGALPPGLKRGVLSEDGLYDLLSEMEAYPPLPQPPGSDGVRPMRPEDREAVLGMMRVFYASPAVFTSGSEEIFESDFAACVSGSPFLNGFVCERDGAVLGYAMTAHSFSTEFGRPCVWIEDIYVSPAARGQGIGKKLLAYIERQNPGALFRLEVEAENEGAVRLYRRSGYTELPYLELKK